MASNNTTINLLFSKNNLSKTPSGNAPSHTISLCELVRDVNEPKTAPMLGPYAQSRRSTTKAHPDVVVAMEMLAGESQDVYTVMNVGKDHYASEIELTDGTIRVTSISFQNGLASSADVILNGNGTLRPAQSDPLTTNGEYDTRGIMLCCLQYIFDSMRERQDMAEVCESGCFSKEACMQMFHDHSDQGTISEDRLRLLCNALSLTIQYGIESGDIKVTIPANGTLSMLTRSQIDAMTGTVVDGKPRVLKIQKPSAVTMTMAEAKQEFSAFASRFQWTPSEQAMIPVLSEDMVVPEEAMKIARRFVATWNDKRPMKNFLWRGVTSFGKSTGVDAIGAMLGIPVVRVTCNTNMETGDFLSSFVPDTGVRSDVPDLDFSDIAYDPEGTYEMLTGQPSDTVSAEECFDTYLRMVRECTSSGGGFRRIESNFIKGLMKGYLVEVQEASRIKDAGVLVGLNEFDRPGAILPLVDGTFARRSENAMVIYTDNVGYDSCRPIDPSVLRRFSFVIDSLELSEDRVMQRLKYNTGCTNEGLMGRLYDIWLRIQQYCKDNEITDGTVSVTELEMWLRLVMLDGETSIRENCQDAVISKATNDPSEQAAIMGSIETLF